MKDLVDQLSPSRPTTLAKRKQQPKKEISLGHLTMGPRVIPPGAKFTTVKGTALRAPIQLRQRQSETATAKESESFSPTKRIEPRSEKDGENGTKKIKKSSLGKSKSEEKIKESETQLDTLSLETPSTEELTPESQDSINREMKSEERETTLPEVYSPKSWHSKEVVLEVVSSLNASEKRLIECIDSQIKDQPDKSVRLMDPHRAHTVIEATKGILVGMKLKLDAAKMLNEMEE